MQSSDYSFVLFACASSSNLPNTTDCSGMLLSKNSKGQGGGPLSPFHWNWMNR